MNTMLSVIEFLVTAGPSTPLDVGSCVLNDDNGRRVWYYLNKLTKAGYVEKKSHGVYVGRPGIAAAQKEMF